VLTQRSIAKLNEFYLHLSNLGWRESAKFASSFLYDSSAFERELEKQPEDLDNVVFKERRYSPSQCNVTLLKLWQIRVQVAKSIGPQNRSESFVHLNHLQEQEEGSSKFGFFLNDA
jgi:hypothetical protein